MANITTCSKCGRSYEEISEEEANRPDRTCLACHYQDREYRIANVYPEDPQSYAAAHLDWYNLDRHRWQCVGGVDRDRDNRTGATIWAAGINAPYDPETDGDWRHIGTYSDRSIALRVLWANRHNAEKD